MFSEKNENNCFKKQSIVMPIIICTIGAIFCLYEFILQVSPGVIANELMHDLHLTAASFGIMAASYYYAYAPMQIVSGLLYDRFESRHIMTIAILMCAAGSFLFSMTHGIFLATLGRFLMGMGSAFSFIGALLLVSRWFRPCYFAFITGIIQLMCSLGAVVGETPLAAIAAHFGWRNTIEEMACAGIVLAILVYLIVRDAPFGLHKNKLVQAGELNRLRSVLKYTQTWLSALISFTIWAPILIFTLWGVPFFIKAYNMNSHFASMLCSIMWIGFGVSGPLIGWWSDAIERRCLPITVAAILGFIAMITIIYIPNLSLIYLFIAMFVVGAAASAISLTYAIVRDNNPPNRVGTAIGFNNMAACAAGILFQPLVGMLLSLHSSISVYSLSDYRVALFVAPLCYLISAITSRYFLRETYCQLKK